MKFKLFFIGLFLVSFAFNTQAQVTKKKVTKTQVKQQKRIKDGVKSGELTKGEVIRLQKQQKEIQRTKRRAKADGKVTAKERANIRRKQVKANKNIARKKHNKKDRN